MTLAENLWRVRKEKHLTQKELADLAGISVMSVRRYESKKELNRRIPSIEDCKKLAQALNMAWWELMGLEDYGNGLYVKEMEPAREAEWVKKLTDISSGADNEEKKLIEYFNQLNEEGKRECLKRVQELAELARYRKE